MNNKTWKFLETKLSKRNINESYLLIVQLTKKLQFEFNFLFYRFIQKKKSFQKKEEIR